MQKIRLDLGEPGAREAAARDRALNSQALSTLKEIVRSETPSAPDTVLGAIGTPLEQHEPATNPLDESVHGELPEKARFPNLVVPVEARRYRVDPNEPQRTEAENLFRLSLAFRQSLRVESLDLDQYELNPDLREGLELARDLEVWQINAVLTDHLREDPRYANLSAIPYIGTKPGEIQEVDFRALTASRINKVLAQVEEENPGTLAPASKIGMKYSEIRELVEWAGPIVAAAYGNDDIHPAMMGGWVIAESSGRPLVVSSAHAIGLMQIKPATAREEAGRLLKVLEAKPELRAMLAEVKALGIENFNEEMLYDGKINVLLGIGYAVHLKERFGNWPEAQSAYNMGPTKYGGIRRGFQSPEAALEWSKNRDYTEDIYKYANKYFREPFYPDEPDILLADVSLSGR